MASGFSVLSVAVLTPQILRVKFSFAPRQADSAALNDALNPLNYSLRGPHLALPSSVAAADNPQSVDVTFVPSLAAGTWTLTVLNVETVDELELDVASDTFVVDPLALTPSVVGGATTEGPADTIRRNMSLEGPSWEALIAAIATGEQINLDNARLAFDQLFRVSASSFYLDRLAAGDGIVRPPLVGLPDNLFRQLDIKLTSRRITEQALLDLLEIFYGTDAITAHLDATLDEPYALDDGLTLSLSDGRSSIDILFEAADFANIEEATALEVSVAITRGCRRANVPITASPADSETGRTVRIRSEARGLASAIRVTGGLAQDALAFPTPVVASIPTGSVFTISAPEPGTSRYSITTVPGTPLLAVQEGDVANVTCAAFHAQNRGSFVVTAVRVVWTGAAWEQWFEVANEDTFAEAGLATLTDQDVLFFRPKTATINDNVVAAMLAQVEDGSFEVILPATTAMVGRHEGTAAYLQPRRLVDLASVTVRADGTALAETDDVHGLVAGDRLLLDGAAPTLEAPAVDPGDPATTGNPGTTDAAQTSLWSALRSDYPASTKQAATLLSTGDILFAGGQDPNTGPPFVTLATATRFRVLGSTTISSGVAAARDRRSYNWIDTSDIDVGGPIASSLHSLTGLFGVMAGQALLVGGARQVGLSFTARIAQKALLYSSENDQWSEVPNGTPVNRYSHVAIRVEDAVGDDVVYLIGGLISTIASTDSVQRFRSTDGGTIEDVTLEPFGGRARHAGCAATAHKWVVAGGIPDPTFPFARTDCFAWDELTDTRVPVGPMAIARADHAMIQVSDGVVMAVGGVGHNPTNEDTDRALRDCEILDVATGRWRPTGKMLHARKSPIVFSTGGLIYATAGLDDVDAPVTQAEVYNPRTGRWSALPATTDATVDSFVGFAQTEDGDLLEHGGLTDTATLFVVGSNVISPKKSLVREVVVSDTPSPTSFTFPVEAGEAASVGATQAERTTAAPGEFKGPFIWDPDEGLAVTSIEATLQDALTANNHHQFLTVDSTEGFPDEQGWVVLAFGRKAQLGPVRYLGVVSGTELLFDFGYLPATTVPAGSKVTLLSQRGPFVPTETDLGAFYLTPSTAGRIAAQQYLAESQAAGLTANVTVKYPGDKGLGNAGQPASGVAKVTDAVYVWGGEDPDNELAAAREEE